MTYVVRMNKKTIEDMTQCLDTYLSGQSTLWLTKYWGTLHRKADEHVPNSAADCIGKYVTYLIAQKVNDKHSDLDLRIRVHEFVQFLKTSSRIIRNLEMADAELEYEVYKAIICSSIEADSYIIPDVNLEKYGTQAKVTWTNKNSILSVVLNRAHAFVEIVSEDKSSEIPLKYPLNISVIAALLDQNGD